jgi:hypothetical protein
MTDATEQESSPAAPDGAEAAPVADATGTDADASDEQPKAETKAETKAAPEATPEADTDDLSDSEMKALMKRYKQELADKERKEKEKKTVPAPEKKAKPKPKPVEETKEDEPPKEPRYGSSRWFSDKRYDS